MSERFELYTTKRLQAVEEIRDMLHKKRELERKIRELIKEFEDNTNMAVDSINYERDITIPLKSSYRYIGLTINMRKEEEVPA